MAEPYFEKYLKRVDPSADRIDQLVVQSERFLQWSAGVDPSTTTLLHAPYTWTLRQVLKHLSDCERVFAFRALWLARGAAEPLQSFDENVFLANSNANLTSWENLLEEFHAVRLASISLFKSLPSDAWSRRGMAAGFPVDVTMLHGMIFGHVDHHEAIMRSRIDALPAT